MQKKFWLNVLKVIPFPLGGLAALGLPPSDMWYGFFVIIPSLLYFWNRSNHNTQKQSFIFGWLFGFGYFLVALHWIGYAFFVNAESDLWMMPFAVGGLAAFLAIYWGLAFFVARLLEKRGHPIWLSLPLCLGLAEYLRGILFTGFPWAAIGQMVDGMGGVAQLASVIGMVGLTLMICLWSASLFGIWRETGIRRIVATFILLSLPAAYMGGEWRLAQNPTRYSSDVVLRLVQPNISQDDKWRNNNARTIYDQLLQMTSAPSSIGKPVTHIIWPESIVPFLIDESVPGRAELATALKPTQTLLAGAVRRDGANSDSKYYTSIIMFNDHADVLAHYDKWRLVPGGEFLPLEWLLKPLGFRHLVNLPESFAAGEGPQTLPVPGAGLAGFSICYEAIFPDAVAARTPRPNWLVNVTNDGWFGSSTGPHQHLAMLRLRAIELGLPAARAANTGISAVIDPLGRHTFNSQLNTIGSFDLLLPLDLGETVYAKFYGISLTLLALLIFFGSVFLRRDLKGEPTAS